jgi:DNA protecting protein DprA
MSEYGKRMAYKIGYELGSTGTVLVSGMALGNDSVAAAGAIAAGGYTVAVLGSGIDMVYPREHEKLYRETLRRGAVITEFPPATPPAGHNFPIRNRIISGLSQGTVVVEGDLRSGAMITAKTAILQGRDIYAFPGNVGETNSSGTNQLISDGASIVLCARDVLNNYAFLYRDTLDMTRLLKAETRSEPDDEHLERLGVSVRITNPRKAEETPLANADRASSEQSLRRSGSPSGNRGETLPSKEPSPRPSAPRPQAVGADTPAPGRDSRGDLRKKPQAPAAPRPSLTGDSSQRILQRLTDTQRRIFEALPLDHAVPIDFLTREGFSTGEVMAAMTILEIHGLTVTLPGGLYARK